jgi:hypothetical protein
MPHGDLSNAIEALFLALLSLLASVPEEIEERADQDFEYLNTKKVPMIFPINEEKKM